MGTGARVIALGVCVAILALTLRFGGSDRGDRDGSQRSGGDGRRRDRDRDRRSPSLLSRLTQGRVLWLAGSGLVTIFLLADWAAKSDDRAEASRWQAKHLEHARSLPTHAAGDVTAMTLQGYRLDNGTLQVGVRRHLYCELATEEVVEGATQVTVRVTGRAVVGLDPLRYCRDLTTDTIALVVVRLRNPLGTRAVIDGTTHRAVPLVTH